MPEEIGTLYLEPGIDVTAPRLNPAPQPVAASEPYARRQIKLTFQLGTNTLSGVAGSLGAQNFNKLEVTGLRCLVNIQQAQMPTPANALIRVQGLTLDQINRLTYAGSNYFLSNINYVAIQAGDVGGQLSTVYNGTIQQAYPDFSTMPDVAFVILANAAPVIQLQPVNPVSFAQPVSAVTALEQVLQPLGVTVEANGVNVTLPVSYFPGTAWQQALKIIQAANLFAYFDPIANKMAVWPKTGARQGSGQIIISPETGMIGYPQFQQARVVVKTRFQPGLLAQLTPGKEIQINSQLSAANGKFIANEVSLTLSSEMPGGPWEMQITATPQKIGQGRS